MKIVSEAQVAANRANAQLSTGPKSLAGKASSSLNHLKFGFTGKFRVMPWEDGNDFDGLLARLQAEHQPETETEKLLVENMAKHHWLVQRALLLQEPCFSSEDPVCHNPELLALYIRYQTTNERAFHKNLDQLLKLRKQKHQEQIGFESQERKKRSDEAAETRRQELHEHRLWLAESQAQRNELETAIAAAKAEANGHSEAVYGTAFGQSLLTANDKRS